MSDIVLKAENISKQYRLGVTGSGTLRDDLARSWARLRGKEDPTLKIGSSNTLNAVEGDYVWALQDINFEVKQGEVLGIIGKNGTGKTTFLNMILGLENPDSGKINHGETVVFGYFSQQGIQLKDDQRVIEFVKICSSQQSELSVLQAR
jgi:lipopolysaccharide transport system ATP-binding protein